MALSIVGGIFLATLLFASMMTSAQRSNSAPPGATQPPQTATPQTGETAQAKGTVPRATATPQPSQTPVPKAVVSTAVPTGAMPDCTAIGQTWTRPSDRAVMMCVPAGNFPMGLSRCDFIGCEREVNGGNVSMPGFWIDQIEVTNDMFQEFVRLTGFVTDAERLGYSSVYGQSQPVVGASWRSPQGPGSSIDGLGNHPVVQISWSGAKAYCLWAGGRLPSEAEWEKAARGTDGRLWPWGNNSPSAQLVNAADQSLGLPQSRLDQNDGFRTTAPVGSFLAGSSPFGVADLAGNAWEWTRSLPKDYPYNPQDGREIVEQPGSADKVIMRGGSWYDDYGSIRSTLRYPGTPFVATDGTGFRCVAP